MRRPSPTLAIALASLVPTLLSACSNTPKASNADLVNANDATRFAYGVGYSLGQDVRAGLEADGLTADEDLVADGFGDALRGHEPDLPKKELDRVLRSVHRVLMDRTAKKRYAEDPEFRQLADANAERSAKAIASFSAQPGARMVEEGVYEIELLNGTGPIPAAGELYVADWNLSLADGVVVDERKGIVVDPDSLLPRAARVLRSMRVGDHRKVAFAPAQAFGLGGDMPAIGPNEAIFVDITVTGSARPEAGDGGAR